MTLASKGTQFESIGWVALATNGTQFESSQNTQITICSLKLQQNLLTSALCGIHITQFRNKRKCNNWLLFNCMIYLCVIYIHFFFSFLKKLHLCWHCFVYLCTIGIQYIPEQLSICIFQQYISYMSQIYLSFDLSTMLCANKSAKYVRKIHKVREQVKSCMIRGSFR